MISRILVRCSTNWAIKSRWKQVKCEFNLYPLYEENDMMFLIKIIWVHCRQRMQVNVILVIMNNYKAQKHSEAPTGFEPMISAIPVWHQCEYISAQIWQDGNTFFLYHIHIMSFSSYNGDKLKNLLLTCFQQGFIAQLVEHHTQNFFWALFITVRITFTCIL